MRPTWSLRGGVVLTLGAACAILAPAAAAQSMAKVTFFGFGEEARLTPDATAGLESIFSGADDYTNGLPLVLVGKMQSEQGLTPDAMWTVFGGLPSPPSRVVPPLPQGLGLQQSAFVRNGAALVNQNCFACHAGVVANQVVAGLGNLQVDAVSFGAQAAQLFALWDQPVPHAALARELSAGELAALGGYIDYLRTMVVPVVQAKGRGDNHGPWVVWELIARLVDPAHGLDLYPAGTTSPLEGLLHRPLPPVRPNPWWRLKYKDRAFWTRDVSPHSLATFALNLMDPAPDNTATFGKRMEATRLKLEFARQTVPPPFAGRAQVNRALAQDGYAYFHGLKPLADGSTLPCAGCHGHYDASGVLQSFPNHTAVDVGTDPEYASILHNDLLPLYQHFALSPFAPTGVDAVHYPDVVGYAPPPLVGIWAAAPYFHNGSVPTVWAVLKSSDRPAYWRKDLDPRAYDQVRLGASGQSLTKDQVDALTTLAQAAGDPLGQASLDLRLVYATTDYGKSNGGHRFGDAMTDAERLAVIEYLKLL